MDKQEVKAGIQTHTYVDNREMRRQFD